MKKRGGLWEFERMEGGRTGIRGIGGAEGGDGEERCKQGED